MQPHERPRRLAQDHERDFTPRQILLIAKVFVRREKYFEPCGLGRFQKHAVFKTPRPCFSAVQTSCPLR